MVKPRYINNEVIVPKPGDKQLKDGSYFIGRAPYEEETTDIEVEVEDGIKQPHLDNSALEPSEWSNLFKDE
mgnify:FL=1|tara:strand:+ start:691 stop:903 length:213 start_codon:yes stop_codon:yes gene_type:complete